MTNNDLETMEDWMRKKYSDDDLRNIVNFGIKIANTEDMYNKFESDIWSITITQLHVSGYDNIFHLLGDHELAGSVNNSYMFKRCMLLHAIEETACKIIVENNNRRL